MKRIEFIAPIAAMRGNLSGAQKLHYGDNKAAWDAAVAGIVSAANYDPSYIGIKILKSGKKVFSLKQKSTTNLDTDSRFAMACFGGGCSWGAAIRKNSTAAAGAQAGYDFARELGVIPRDLSFEGYVMKQCHEALESKAQVVEFPIRGNVHAGAVNNPWVTGGSGTTVDVPTKIVTKFESQLSAA